MGPNRRIVALTGVVAALCSAAPAAAGSSGSKPTAIRIGGTSFYDSGDTATADVSGSLESVKRCVGGRTVKVYAFIGERKKLLDVDISSRNGSFSGQGTVRTNPDGYQVVAERDKRGKVVCREGSVAT